MKNVFFLLLSLLLVSCARVGSPVGGKKDSIPPHFIGSNIDSARVNVPQDIRELRLDFDEYVTLKDISRNLIISPPITRIKRILPSNLANKYVLIQWEDTLQANTTYNFNFGNAIADNNEGNILPYFNYAFSTGDKIDNLYISGTVTDGLQAPKKTTEPNKYVVGLYKVSDPVDYRQKPYYITKVDPDGYFELNYLAPGNYRIIAFDDTNQNSIYEPGKEGVGFLKDNVQLGENNISGMTIRLFPSKKAVRYAEAREQPGGVLMIFEGAPRQVEILSLNEKLTDYRVTHTPNSDSSNVWFDAVKQNIGQNQSEMLRFSYNADGKQDTVTVPYRYNAKTELTLNNNSGAELAPESPLELISNVPLQSISTESWTLKQDSITKNFSARISATDPRKILVTSDFVPRKNYQFTVPKETARSYYLSNTVSKRFDFEVGQESGYGSLTLKLLHRPQQDFWVELLDEANKVVFSRKTNAEEIKFPVLKPNTYRLRILVDNNGNGIWDGADFARGIAAEDAYLFPKTITIRPLWDNIESWDLAEQAVPATPEN